MRKKENPYFVGGAASMSIKIDRRDKPENNISWNDGETQPLLPTSKSNIQTDEIKIDHRKPLWV